MTKAFGVARSLLAAAWGFFVHHYPVVLAFGALASAQRFVAVGDIDFPLAESWVGETFTMLVRIAFVVWVVRRVLRDRPAPAVGSHVTGTVVASTVYLMALSLVSKIGLDAIGSQLVSEEHQSTYFSWELAIKNVTVIPFVLVWVVVLVTAVRDRRPDEAVLSASAERARDQT
ncbi:hypothetical protein [Mumia zhuanghuii]|uniref:hypothetical protein n=1 Tax=Mumia zhuanghuii TaxID=2585211 RepID=UPI00363D51AE